MGSSTSTALGRCRNAAHMTSRCFMPWEKLSTSSSFQATSSNSSSSSARAGLDCLAVHPVEAAVEAQELAGGELLVEERPVGNEAERALRRLGLPRQVVARRS